MSASRLTARCEDVLPIRKGSADSALRIAEGRCKGALAREAGQLCLGPVEERLDQRLGQLLAVGVTHLGRLAGDVALDVVERPDPVERLVGDLRFGGEPDIMEVTAQMRPARGFAEASGAAVRSRNVKLRIADRPKVRQAVAIGLQLPISGAAN